MDQDHRHELAHKFDRYVKTRDRTLRDQIIADHMRLAEHLARRFTNRGVPLDDLIQVASLGLVEAVERFEPDRGLEFSTFATPTIVGELKRHFRDKGWSVRVPRRVQELHVQVNSVVAELNQQLGRAPTIAEIAGRADASEEKVLEAMEASRSYRSASIDAPDDEEGPGLAAQLGEADQDLFHAENRVLIDDLLDELPGREQLMLRLRFYDDMTQAEVADRLGISQMHVSRLLGRSLDVLRQRAGQ